jgi:hypothetical protein
MAIFEDVSKEYIETPPAEELPDPTDITFP